MVARKWTSRGLLHPRHSAHSGKGFAPWRIDMTRQCPRLKIAPVRTRARAKSAPDIAEHGVEAIVSLAQPEHRGSTEASKAILFRSIMFVVVLLAHLFAVAGEKAALTTAICVMPRERWNRKLRRKPPHNEAPISPPRTPPRDSQPSHKEAPPTGLFRADRIRINCCGTAWG